MLLRFPTELLERVAVFTPDHDLKCLRLACSAVNGRTSKIWGPRLFGQFDTNLSRFDLEYAKDVLAGSRRTGNVGQYCIRMRFVRATLCWRISGAQGGGYSWPRNGDGNLEEPLEGLDALWILLEEHLPNCTRFQIESTFYDPDTEEGNPALREGDYLFLLFLLVNKRNLAITDLRFSHSNRLLEVYKDELPYNMIARPMRVGAVENWAKLTSLHMCVRSPWMLRTGWMGDFLSQLSGIEMLALLFLDGSDESSAPRALERLPQGTLRDLEIQDMRLHEKLLPRLLMRWSGTLRSLKMSTIYLDSVGKKEWQETIVALPDLLPALISIVITKLTITTAKGKAHYVDFDLATGKELDLLCGGDLDHRDELLDYFSISTSSLSDVPAELETGLLVARLRDSRLRKKMNPFVVGFRYAGPRLREVLCFLGPKARS